MQVPENEINYATEEIVEMEQGNDHQEYFDYVTEALRLPPASDWQEAHRLYNRLMHAAENSD